MPYKIVKFLKGEPTHHISQVNNLDIVQQVNASIKTDKDVFNYQIIIVQNIILPNVDDMDSCPANDSNGSAKTTQLIFTFALC